MLYDLRNHAEVKFYGPGWPGCDYTVEDYRARKTISVPMVIEDLYPGDYPDVVMQMGPSSHGLWRRRGGVLFSMLEGFSSSNCLRVLIIEDLHNDVAQPSVLKAIQTGEVDLVLKMYDVENVTEWSKILEELGVAVEWYPFSFDPKLFYDRGLPRIYDVINLGQRTTQNYPIRYKIHEILSEQDEIKYVGLGERGKPHVVPHEDYRHARVKGKTGVRGEAYALMINRSRMFATDCSTLKFAVQKMYEVMACNTLLVCNTPLDAEKLGFKPGHNYVEIDDYPAQASEARPEKFMKPIRHYLKHPEEARKIAQRGHDLVHSRHTHKIRNRNIINKISRYL